MKRIKLILLILMLAGTTNCTAIGQNCHPDDPNCDPALLALLYNYYSQFVYATYSYIKDGIDGTPGTADDGWGADGITFTADDIASSYSYASLSSKNSVFNQSFGFANALLAKSFAVGSDLIAGTGDDTQNSETSYFYLAPGGSQLSYSISRSSGTDTILFTSDDPLTRSAFDYSKLRYTSQSAGADGIFDTADDTLPTSSTDYTVDASNNITGNYSRNYGADTTADTVDDSVSGCTVYQYGTGTFRFLSGDPGADAICFTSDDSYNNYADYTFTATGSVATYISYSSGADAILFTSDDVLNSYTEYKYDFNGDRVLVINTDSTGAILSYIAYSRLLLMP